MTINKRKTNQLQISWNKIQKMKLIKRAIKKVKERIKCGSASFDLEVVFHYYFQSTANNLNWNLGQTIFNQNKLFGFDCVSITRQHWIANIWINRILFHGLRSHFYHEKFASCLNWTKSNVTHSKWQIAIHMKVLYFTFSS